MSYQSNVRRIKKLRDQFKLIQMPTKYTTYEGLLYPTDLFFAYDMPCLAIEIKVRPYYDGKFKATAVIYSTDDSGCLIYGDDSTSLEEAEKIAQDIKNFFEQRDDPLRCPTMDELQPAMKNLNLNVELM